MALSSREQAIMREVMKRTTINFTTEDWKIIATKAGVTDGDIARNAKYAFNSAKKKLTAGSAAEEENVGGAKPSPKRGLDSLAENGKESSVDSTPTKKSKASRSQGFTKVKEEKVNEE